MFVSQNCRLFLLMQCFLKSLVNLVETLIKKKRKNKRVYQEAWRSPHAGTSVQGIYSYLAIVIYPTVMSKVFSLKSGSVKGASP